MLIDYRFSIDPISQVIAAVNGNRAYHTRLAQGVYERGDFGMSPFAQGFEDYPELGDDFGCYGVCDDYKQVLEKITVLHDPERKFVVLVTPVLRGNQPRDGGWRWHKWGEYIGTKTPTCEYLHDEPEIEKVYCYHIYEKMN